VRLPFHGYLVIVNHTLWESGPAALHGINQGIPDASMIAQVRLAAPEKQVARLVDFH
jgi:hypothetical protein